MKRTLITIALLAMVCWTIYKFVFSSNTIRNDNDVLEELADDQLKNEQESTASEIKIGLDVGDRAPDFELTTLEGDVVSLSDYEGSPVMINFWATWCPPCRAEMPDMEQFHQNTAIEILAINLTQTEESDEQVQEFIDQYELTFPILMDEAIEVALLYQIQPIPTSIFLDAERTIQFVAYGALTYDQMNEVLEDIN